MKFLKKIVQSISNFFVFWVKKWNFLEKKLRNSKKICLKSNFCLYWSLPKKNCYENPRKILKFMKFLPFLTVFYQNHDCCDTSNSNDRLRILKLQVKPILKSVKNSISCEKAFLKKSGLSSHHEIQIKRKLKLNKIPHFPFISHSKIVLVYHFIGYSSIFNITIKIKPQKHQF